VQPLLDRMTSPYLAAVGYGRPNLHGVPTLGHATMRVTLISPSTAISSVPVTDAARILAQGSSNGHSFSQR
jgi:hypothetical protein